MAEVVPAGTVTSQTMTRILDSLFARWGMPCAITTDNGPQLISAEFSTFLSNKGIKHIRAALYHPQANGGVERFNQSLKNGIRVHLVQGYSFQMALNQTLLHYRASQHSTTQASPALLMLGREMELPLDRLRAQGLSATVVTGPQAAVKVVVTTSQGRMKDNFYKRHKVRHTNIKVLDWVRVRRPHRSSKMASFWSEPHQVVRLLASATFLLSDGSRWHASRL